MLFNDIPNRQDVLAPSDFVIFQGPLGSVPKLMLRAMLPRSLQFSLHLEIVVL